MNNEITYNISKHARERYVQRLLNKEDNNEIQRFIVENEEKIQTDINKMIVYGDLIYSGKQSQKDGKGSVVDVYLKDCWIVLTDQKSNNVITLYKIDLGCGDDFNLQYIDKMMNKLNESKQKLENAETEVSVQNTTYRELIDEAETQINEYKAMIKNLESLCEGYKMVIDNNIIKSSQANREVADVLNTLIGKREF